MCIRDRKHRARLDQVAQSARQIGAAGQQICHMIQPRVAAVSYTHLRAHETVLELVCRLLLDKKQDII